MARNQPQYTGRYKIVTDAYALTATVNASQSIPLRRVAEMPRGTRVCSTTLRWRRR